MFMLRDLIIGDPHYKENPPVVKTSRELPAVESSSNDDDDDDEEITESSSNEHEEKKEEDMKEDIDAVANAAVASATAPLEEDVEEEEAEEEAEKEVEEVKEAEEAEKEAEEVEVEEEEQIEISKKDIDAAANAAIAAAIAPLEEEEESDDEEEEKEAGIESAPPKEDDASYSSCESYDSDESYTDESEEEEEEDITNSTLSERRSLLLLAAEHDRVDILKAVFTASEEKNESVSVLLNDLTEKEVPALHVAMAHGSTHAASCLLRMGADPSLRPTDVDVKEKKRYEGKTAWEIVFGGIMTTSTEEEEEEEEEAEEVKGWFFSRASPKVTTITTTTTTTSTTSPTVVIAPSKLEGLKHAFTAEALRCIGSDEEDRLKQLLESGMSLESEVGGRDLRDWCVELGAKSCLSMLGRDYPEEEEEEEEKEEEMEEEVEDSKILAAPQAPNEQTETTATTSETAPTITETTETPPSSPPSKITLSQVQNLRTSLTESSTLAAALSTVLDNLAEETSVCQAILLHNSSSASTGLATHVRTSKRRIDSTKDDLVDWKRETEYLECEVQSLWERLDQRGRKEVLEGEWRSLFVNSIGGIISSSVKEVKKEEEDLEKVKMELEGQLAASETKVRKLRTSIASLAEENAKSLAEVEQRGLSGAIQLARTLREDLREVDFELASVQATNFSCKTKMGVLKRKLKEQDERTKKAKKGKKSGRKARGLNNGHSTSLSQESSQQQQNEDGISQQQTQQQQEGAPNSEETATDEDDEELTPLMNRNHHLASTNAWLVPVSALMHMNKEEEEDGADDSDDDGSSYEDDDSDEDDSSYEDDEYSDSEEEEDTPRSAPSIKIQTGDSTAIILRNTDSNGYLSIDIWELIRRIIGIGREVASRSVQTFREEGSSLVMTV